MWEQRLGPIDCLLLCLRPLLPIEGPRENTAGPTSGTRISYNAGPEHAPTYTMRRRRHPATHAAGGLLLSLRLSRYFMLLGATPEQVNGPGPRETKPKHDGPTRPQERTTATTTAAAAASKSGRSARPRVAAARHRRPRAGVVLPQGLA